MTDLAGRITIELNGKAGSPLVHIRSSRPVSASRVFVGKGIAETASALPALFSVCANAQASACASACEAALAREAAADVAALRNLLVSAETVKEHLWRMLLDWPQFLGGTPDARAMARVMSAFTRLRGAATRGGNPFRPGTAAVEPEQGALETCLDDLAAVTTDQVLGMEPTEWLSRSASADGLLSWAREARTPAAALLREIDAQSWQSIGSSPVPALPELSASQFEALLGGADADAFVAAPQWNGTAAESTPFTRNSGHPAVAGLLDLFGNGLLARLAAQLVELVWLHSQLRQPQNPAEKRTSTSGPGAVAGIGIARVDAARGLLIHRVAVADDEVLGYRILAPTEWNFHPRGPVAAGLAEMRGLDQKNLSRLVRLFVTAVDPCVEYDVIFR